MSGDQSTKDDERKLKKIEMLSVSSGSKSVDSESSSNGSKIDLSLQGATLDAVVAGTIGLEQLFDLAQKEFGVGKSQAITQVLKIINQWQTLREVNSGGSKVLSEDQTTSRKKSNILSTMPEYGSLKSPTSELNHFRKVRNILEMNDAQLSLDDQLWLMTHRGSTEQRSVRDSSASTVATSPSVMIASSSNFSDSMLTGSQENDGDDSRMIVEERDTEEGDMEVSENYNQKTMWWIKCQWVRR
jgi:hypothetical protein